VDLKERILELIEGEIQGSSFFVVDCIGSEQTGKIQILLDGDDGVSIDTCVALSRKVSRVLDEEYDGDPFRFEISSPGVDRPLVLPRQYAKHIGRSLEIELGDKTMKAELLEAGEKEIRVQELKEQKQKHLKDAKGEILSIPFAEIKSSKVIISFK